MPLKQCCASGSLHAGTPTGKVGKVHGLDCYTAEAPNESPKGFVVIVPDAFGWTFPNNRILADEYAKKGNFTVVREPLRIRRDRAGTIPGLTTYPLT